MRIKTLVYNIARTLAGLLLALHLFGWLWFAPTFGGVLFAYAALVAAALGVFCFFPRNWLPGSWRPVAALAVAAMAATFAVAYKDLTLVGGANYSALEFRLVVVGFLIVMLSEAVSRRTPSKAVA